MAGIGLKEAARLTGKNQSTIHRAMKSNRLSFTVSEIGERLIDPAELERVFTVKSPDEIARKQDDDLAGNVTQIAELRVQLEAERAAIAGVKERIADKDAMIADLREDRDRWRGQAERLLLSQQPPPRRSWWPWGRG
jgi:hypothetical protein